MYAVKSARSLGVVVFSPDEIMQKKLWVLVGVLFALIGITCMLPVLAQPQSYHDFADKRTFFGISNFSDVVSNIAFILVGLYGLSKKPKGLWIIFFVGAILTGIFSGFYHLEPNDERLAFDRMAMTVLFMSFLSIILNERTGYTLAPLLLFLGIASVVYWMTTQDLRFYGLVQFGTGVLIVALLILFPRQNQAYIYTVFALLACSKLAESYDKEIYQALHHTLSGHTLKHLLSASALFVIAKQPRNS